MERIDPQGSPQSIVRRLTTSSSDCAERERDEPSMADNVMNRLHERMSEIYGHRWTSQYTRESLETWAKGLGDMTKEQVGRGVNACIAGAFAWPPTLPEFRELCLTVPGLPSPDEAWTEAWALASRWKPESQCSNPVVWHAYCETNMNADEETAKKRFLKQYQFASQLFSRGEPMRSIPLALPAKSVVPPTPEEIAERAAYAAEKLAAIGIKVSV